MAITTLAGLLAGKLPQKQLFWKTAINSSNPRDKTYWAATGTPPAGSYSASLDGATCDNTTTGALPFVNPASGNTYLVGAQIGGHSAGNSSQPRLLDRLWHNGGYDPTSLVAQNSTTPTWPARDANGSTNGEGVFLEVEISSAMGAGTPNISIVYTNSSGTGSRTATNPEATLTTQAASTINPIILDAGDTGVRSVQSLTLSATWTSGALNLVACRPITIIPGYYTSFFGEALIDALSPGGMQRIYDSSCLYLAHTGNTGSQHSPCSVSITFAQG